MRTTCSGTSSMWRKDGTEESVRDKERQGWTPDRLLPHESMYHYTQTPDQRAPEGAWKESARGKREAIGKKERDNLSPERGGGPRRGQGQEGREGTWGGGVR